MFLLTETLIQVIIILQIETGTTMIKQNTSEIYKIISRLGTQEDVKIFLNELLTESELSDITQRWSILKMLSEKKSQRNISKELTVSLCKITRGAKILKNENSIIRQILFDGSWRK